jgi:hypothetical protein
LHFEKRDLGHSEAIAMLCLKKNAMAIGIGHAFQNAGHFNGLSLHNSVRANFKQVSGDSTTKQAAKIP